MSRAEYEEIADKVFRKQAVNGRPTGRSLRLQANSRFGWVPHLHSPLIKATTPFLNG